MTDPQTSSTAVLVVGGGPVGLAMGLLMHRFGIECIVVERGATTTDHPKSRGCWIRTMELFRQWGIEHRVRARGLAPNTDIFVFAESMAGEEMGRTRPEADLGQTPAWKSLVAQDVVEEELLREIGESPFTKVMYSTECISVNESDDGVTAEVRPTRGGDVRRIRARYLIAADGAASNTRREAGIAMNGPSNIAVMANDYWRGDLSRLPMAQQAAGFRLVPKDPAVPTSTILNTNGRDRWLTVSQIGILEDERSAPWTDDDVTAIARKHTGLPDLDVQIINRSIWRVSRQVAASFRKGRIFLVGDAAHRFPPTGGFGLNSGVQDAHNLAWKLAYVLRGQASERLLESYDEERRPVAESNADFSYGNRLRFGAAVEACRSGDEDRMRFWINDMDNHLHSVGQGLGFSYKSGAVVQDGTASQGFNSRYYAPSDRPGGRFPHLWLDMARKQSTLDWFDKDMTLVTGPQGDAWLQAGRDVAAKLGMPLGLRRLPSAYPADGFQLGPRGAVLVRPDGHVAWRMPWVPNDPAQELAMAIAKILQ